MTDNRGRARRFQFADGRRVPIVWADERHVFTSEKCIRALEAEIRTLSEQLKNLQSTNSIVESDGSSWLMTSKKIGRSRPVGATLMSLARSSSGYTSALRKRLRLSNVSSTTTAFKCNAPPNYRPPSID